MSEWNLNGGNLLESQQYSTKCRLKNLPIQNTQKITYLSHCPEKQCFKYYVDTLLGRYYFICLDEHHDRTDLEGGNN